MPSLRRSDRESEQAAEQDTGRADTVRTAERTDRPAPEERPARDRRRWGRGRDGNAVMTEKLDRAAERAAAATRTAAAAAASERARARPRTSGMALLGLALGVLAAAAVATGALAGVGIALGVLAVLFAFGGLAATGHRYRFLAGRGAATVALLLALAAIVVGVLAVTGALSWLSPETDQVARLRDWLPGWLT